MPRFRNNNASFSGSSKAPRRSISSTSSRVTATKEGAAASVAAENNHSSSTSFSNRNPYLKNEERAGNQSRSIDTSKSKSNSDASMSSLGIEDEYFSSDLSFDYGIDEEQDLQNDFGSGNPSDNDNDNETKNNNRNGKENEIANETSTDDGDDDDDDDSTPPTEVIWSSGKDSDKQSPPVPVTISPKQKSPVSILRDRHQNNSNQNQHQHSPLLSPTRSVGSVDHGSTTPIQTNGNGHNTTPPPSSSKKRQRISFDSDVEFRQKKPKPSTTLQSSRRDKTKREKTREEGGGGGNGGISSNKRSNNPYSPKNGKNKGKKRMLSSSRRKNQGSVSSSSSSLSSSSSSSVVRPQDSQQQSLSPTSNASSATGVKSSRIKPSPLINHTSTATAATTDPTTLTNNATSNKPSWMPKRGLAIDTRTIQSFTGDAVGNTFSQHMNAFLRSSNHQGVLPCLLSTTAWKESKSKSTSSSLSSSSRVRSQKMNSVPNLKSISTSTRVNAQPMIEAKVIHTSDWIESTTDTQHHANTINSELTFVDNKNDDWTDLLSSVSVRAPSNMYNTKNRDAVHVPKRLLASDSWRMFGDMMDSIVKKQQQCGSSPQQPQSSSSSQPPASPTLPLDITVMTHDVALFTDTNVDSHKRAVTRLWERLREKFDSNQIRSVNIVVFQSGADALEPSSTWNGGMDIDHDDDDDAESTRQMHVGEDETGRGKNDRSAATTKDQFGHVPHRFKVAHCAKVVQSHLSHLLDKEFKRNSGLQHGRGSPMEVSFEGKDFHSIHFQSIIRDWSREIMLSASGTGCISFDLPETLDGTQCSVMLNLSYSILPYPVNSVASEGLVQNLKSWTECYFEVVQLVPLDEVDLSLIYGVPITAKAGLDGDLEQYREMQKLVAELWKYLASKDVAMVLRCIKDAEANSYGEEKPFFGGGGQKIFLLMAQIPSDEMRGESGEKFMATGNGMLYQYLSDGNQILDKRDSGDFHEVEDNDYTEVIKCSLEFLDCAKVNPCTLHQ